MNYSDTYRYVILTPPRQATRFLAGVFKSIEFGNDVEGGDNPKTRPFTHRLEIPEGKEDYKLICTIRNPYNRYLSIYRWQSIFSSTNLHKITIDHMVDYNDIIEIDSKYGVDYWVDTENIYNDLLKIPIVSENFDKLKHHFEEPNPYKEEGKHEGEITQQIADEIYESYKFVFDKFGYDKDSWK